MISSEVLHLYLGGKMPVKNFESKCTFVFVSAILYFIVAGLHVTAQDQENDPSFTPFNAFLPIDLDGDGSVTYGDYSVFQLWVKLGGDPLEAISYAQKEENGILDLSDFFSSRQAYFSNTNTLFPESTISQNVEINNEDVNKDDSGNTLDVGDGYEYATIRAALWDAVDGDTILVHQNCIGEINPLVINKNVTIKGDNSNSDNWRKIKTTNVGYTLFDIQNSCKLQYLHIEGNYPSKVHVGIKIELDGSDKKAEINSCKINSFDHTVNPARGISIESLKNSAEVSVKYCIISENGKEVNNEYGGVSTVYVKKEAGF